MNSGSKGGTRASEDVGEEPACMHALIELVGSLADRQTDRQT